MATALDYSGGRPSGAAVRTAGHAGVVRYVGTPGNRKNISSPEYADMVRNGVAVALVYEHLAGDSSGGFVAGQAAARAARADADSIGFPPDRPIYFAVDSDQVTEAQFAAAMSYLDGAVSVLGRTRVGVYGEYDVIEQAIPSHAQYGWQTAAWSKGKRSAKAALYQRVGSTLVGGIACDINDILLADWGQHNAHQEDDMQLTDTIHQWDKTTNTVEETIAGMFGRLVEIHPQVASLVASMAGLTAAVAAATHDPAITVDALKAIVNEAVVQHVQITGTVHIGPADGAA